MSVLKIIAGVVTASTLVNADVDAAAAIAGSKISPDFGAQNIQSTGDVTARSISSSLNMSCGNNFTAAGSVYVGGGGVQLVISGVSASVLTFGAAATSVAIGQGDAGNVVAANLSLIAQSAVGGASVGGDLQVGGGTGNANGFVDFRNQTLGTGGATVAGGTLLTGLFAKTLKIKIGGTFAYVLCLT